MPEVFITEQQERPPPVAEHCRIEISLEKSSPYVAFGAVSMATITPVKTHERNHWRGVWKRRLQHFSVLCDVKSKSNESDDWRRAPSLGQPPTQWHLAPSGKYWEAAPKVDAMPCPACQLVQGEDSGEARVPNNGAEADAGDIALC